jgi:hypothetical protein
MPRPPDITKGLELGGRGRQHPSHRATPAPPEPRFFASASRLAGRPCLEHIALVPPAAATRGVKNSQSRLRGSDLRRVRRLSLGLVYLLVRLGGSLLDVERELHVVIVDANAIARLD